MTTDRARTNIRFPPDLYAEIKAIAEAKGQSINEAVTRLLRAGIDAEKGSAEPDRLANIERRLERLEAAQKK